MRRFSNPDLPWSTDWTDLFRRHDSRDDGRHALPAPHRRRGCELDVVEGMLAFMEKRPSGRVDAAYTRQAGVGDRIGNDTGSWQCVARRGATRRFRSRPDDER